MTFPGFPSLSLASPADSCYLRLSVTDRCNFRCRYCRPAPREDRRSGAEVLALPEILRAVRWIDAARPLRKIRITGGEPLLRPGLEELVRELRRCLPAAELCLTTNGSLLAPHAEALRASGLRRVNVSLDALDPGSFLLSTGRPGPLAVLEGIAAARLAGLEPVKLNSVLQRRVNGERLPELVLLAARLGCEIRFIELMRLGPARELHAADYLPGGEALSRLAALWPDPRPLPAKGTARRWTFRTPEGEVTVGLITPVSQPFCGGCDRLRLDAGGRLHACLRRDDGLDLRPLVGSAASAGEAARLIRALLEGKRAPENGWQAGTAMWAIGG